MNTPICDFVKNYSLQNTLRLHMPGHKGCGFLGCESLDITEISGADSLYDAEGIIRESEKNASSLFGTEATFYSTEGSSLCIRAMLELIRKFALKKGQKASILAGRNAHKVFTLTAGLLDIDVEWLYKKKDTSYLSSYITPKELDSALKKIKEKPTALYITSPDYLGNIADIKGLSQVCKKHGVLLAVDNAHGAYLKFLTPSLHPMDLGADICCDSAHKTLPVLTGGAYLHISDSAPKEFVAGAKKAMALFGSTSPSYLILQSLDMANKYIADGYSLRLVTFISEVENLKSDLKKIGYTVEGNEPLKITLKAKPYGYTGFELAKILESENVFTEFSDPDYVVLMLTPEIGKAGLELLKKALANIPKKSAITTSYPPCFHPERVMDIHSALFADSEEVTTEKAVGRVLSSANVGCPPAVPILCCGEKITQKELSLFDYYGVKKITVVK